MPDIKSNPFTHYKRRGTNLVLGDYRNPNSTILSRNLRNGTGEENGDLVTMFIHELELVDSLEVANGCH
jgi:hypothetical protein